MVLRGQDIVITEDDGSSFIAAAKSHVIDIQCDEIETAGGDSPDYKDFIAGRKEWTVSIAHLIGDISEDAIRIGRTYEIWELNRRTQQLRTLGTVVCTRASITATKGSLVSGSLLFRGKGKIYPSPGVGV
jgi:hypothetical protein